MELDVEKFILNSLALSSYLSLLVNCFAFTCLQGQGYAPFTLERNDRGYITVTDYCLGKE